MPKTISTHTGSAAHRDHNIRNPKATDKQDHIDKGLRHQNEIIVDERPRDAYQRLFGASLEKYNAGQIAKGHPERVIEDYFAHIQGDAKKHPVYEMIVQIGDRKDTGIDCPVEKACMREFLAGWRERNPNLEVIGAYLHADEADGTAHMHIDYIPVIRDCKRGLEVQTGLSRALGQQGFEKGKSYKDTPQIRWEARENAALEAICMAHGIEIHHPMRDGAEERREHLDTAIYKAQEALKDAQAGVSMAQDNADAVLQQMVDTGEQLVEMLSELGEAQKTLDSAQGDIKALAARESALKGQISALEGQIGTLEGQRTALTADVAKLEAKKETLTAAEVEALKGTKTLTGALKGVTYTEYEALKKTAARVDDMEREVVSAREEVRQAYADANQQLAVHKQRLNKEYQDLTNKAFAAGDLNITVRMQRDLEAAEKERDKLRRQVSVFREAIERLKDLAPAIWNKITEFLHPKLTAIEKEFEKPEHQPKAPRVARWDNRNDHDER